MAFRIHKTNLKYEWGRRCREDRERERKKIRFLCVFKIEPCFLCSLNDSEKFVVFFF